MHTNTAEHAEGQSASTSTINISIRCILCMRLWMWMYWTLSLYCGGAGDAEICYLFKTINKLMVLATVLRILHETSWLERWMTRTVFLHLTLDSLKFPRMLFCFCWGLRWAPTNTAVSTEDDLLRDIAGESRFCPIVLWIHQEKSRKLFLLG